MVRTWLLPPGRELEEGRAHHYARASGKIAAQVRFDSGLTGSRPLYGSRRDEHRLQPGLSGIRHQCPSCFEACLQQPKRKGALGGRSSSGRLSPARPAEPGAYGIGGDDLRRTRAESPAMSHFSLLRGAEIRTHPLKSIARDEAQNRNHPMATCGDRKQEADTITPQAVGRHPGRALGSAGGSEEKKKEPRNRPAPSP